MTHKLLSCCALILALIASPLRADVTDLLNPMADKTASDETTSPAAPQKSLADLLAQAKSDLADVSAAPNPDDKTREPLSEDAINERRGHLENIQRAYEDQLTNEQRIGDVQKRLDVFKQEQNLTLDPQKGPPFAITYADKLERIAERTAANVSSRELQLEFLRQQFQAQLEEVKNADAVQRQRDEALETATDPTARDPLSRAVELAQLIRREAQANLGVVRSTILYNEEFLKFEREKLALAQGHVSQLNHQITFTKADLERLVTKYKGEQGDYGKEAQLVSKYAKQTRRTYDAKRQEFAAEKDKPHPPEDTAANGRLTDLEKQVGDLSADTERAERLAEMVQHSIDIAGIKRNIWEARYKIFTQRSPEAVASAQGVVSSANRWLEGRSKLLISKINHDSVDDKSLSNVLKSKISYSDIRERVLQDAELVGWSARKLRQEIEASHGRGSLGQQVKSGAQTLLFQLKILWAYELFAVTDTAVIDGKTVNLSRGITVGKIVRALIFILLGALAVMLLARLGEKHAVRKLGWREESARIARRWIHRVGVVALIITALAWVNIPLSIFAFMGGALAIGFGFGVQNLFKNLICGVMLLLERPLRIGDLVELDGVRGTVINIGIRSVTIRSASGIETLVPNSLFIEQKLTNWTYSNSIVRFNFTVGVDYQAPVDKVRDILTAALNADPLILNQPRPEVSLDDFGPDSLMFSVYYWLDLSAEGSSRNVASELRYTICHEFAAANINMAYTQRDVHIHASSPLRVELLKTQDDDTG